MNMQTNLPPPDVLLAGLILAGPQALATFIEGAIDLLNCIDDDPDLEPEEDCDGAGEDYGGHVPPRLLDPINAGPSLLEDSDTEYTYAEWHTLPAGQQWLGGVDGDPLDPCAASVSEDAEDDDPAELNGDEQDCTWGMEADGERFWRQPVSRPRYGVDQSKGPTNQYEVTLAFDRWRHSRA